ncbi:ATPase [Aureococcus anophagefferens]|uniref:ATPase n=1 Tax=Aureococcus anophagefferens TaxID=44056 RepID=A0ABR1FJT6_AURAN
MSLIAPSREVALVFWQPANYFFAQTSGYPVHLNAVSEYNPAKPLMLVSFTRWAYEAIIAGVFHRGWGEDLSRSDIFASFGYPDYLKLWQPVLPVVAFVVAVKAAMVPLLSADERGTRDDLSARDAVAVAPRPPPVASPLPQKAEPYKDVDEDVEKGAATTVVAVAGVDYSVRLPDGAVRPILADVAFKADGLTAVMGPSGAGKSTLLDVVAGRKTTGFGKGSILYDGVHPTAEDRKRLQVYVMQNDVSLGTLSVEETLAVAATLRARDGDVGGAVRRALHLLDLAPAAGRLVADASACERRLLSVAVEFVTLPAVAFLDEPTSNLDAAAAACFFACLRRALSATTVLCTVHQPSSDVFAAFSHVLAVGGGRILYDGSPGSARDFAAARLADVDAELSAAELVIAFCLEAPTLSAKNGGKVAPPEAGGYDLDRDGGRFSAVDDAAGPAIARRLADFCHETRTLMARNAIVRARKRRALVASVARNVIVAVWYGTVYWKCDAHGVASVSYFSLQFVAMSNMLAVTTLFEERPLFYRELAARDYGPAAYVVAHSLVNAAYQVPLVLLYCAVCFPMVGLRTDGDHFFFAYAALYVVALIGFVFSATLAAAAPRVQVALNMYSTLFQFNLFFSGYSIPVSQVKWYFHWATQTSFARPAFDALLVNELRGVESYDDDEDADYWLDYWGLEGKSRMLYLGQLLLVAAVVHALALLAATLCNFQRQ